MPLPMMVLPLEGGSPSAVMVIVFPDAVMLIYGNCDDEGFLTVDKGNFRVFGFDRYPFLKEIKGRGGELHLHKLSIFIRLERLL